jgi:hypothetical protein
MEKLYISPTDISPEIILSPDTWELSISGTSAPEDVRGLYYPVIQWTTEMVNTILENPGITGESGVRMTIDLKYFNSSSGKFLHDIFTELSRLKQGNGSLEIRWFFDKEDVDMEEAAYDMAQLAGLEFICLPK